MHASKRRTLRNYSIGMGCTFAGAWLTGVVGSMWPLALGASAALLCTAPLVKAIWVTQKRD